MSDATSQNRPLSEISHLFLSNVRDLPKPGAPRPVRIPPGGPRLESTAAPVAMSRRDESIDLTPEEFAEVFGKIDLGDDDIASKKPIVTAVLASHLAGNQAERVKDYARHYAVTTGHRVGLIEVDASEFRLMCFEPGVESHAAVDDGGEGEAFDPRHMAETIEELNVDVDRWLLLVANPRLPEARTLLRGAQHWVLLSTCDHDGVVSCYRTLKGLSDLHRPRLSLALLDAPNETEATLIHRKLQSVCQQFLSWPLEQQAMIEPAGCVAETLVMNCRPLHDKAQLAAAPQWQIVGDFLATAQPEPIESISPSESTDTMHDIFEDPTSDSADAETAALATSDHTAVRAEPVNDQLALEARRKQAEFDRRFERRSDERTQPTSAIVDEPSLKATAIQSISVESTTDVEAANDSFAATIPIAHPATDFAGSFRAAHEELHDRSTRNPAPAATIGFASHQPTIGFSNSSAPVSFPRPSAEPTAFATREPQPTLKLQTEASDVVDLPSIDASPSTILSAVIRHSAGQLVESPVRPPMCPDATLAVDREHGLVLLAVAKAGLADFRQIALAYQWLSQNRQLIGMAVPQFTIDIHRQPQLKLLVDHRDMSADLLQPMLEAGHVSVQAYRKLRWGEKTGLLLEAA